MNINTKGCVFVFGLLLSEVTFATQYTSWRVTSPSGLEGQLFSSAAGACAAGIARKESDVHAQYPERYEHRRTGDIFAGGPYTWGGGAEAYCSHEYRSISGSPSDWATFWPYSGANVQGMNTVLMITLMEPPMFALKGPLSRGHLGPQTG